MTPLPRHAETSPHATAVIDRRGRCTYAELLARATRMADALASRHRIEAGDRVATLLPNGIAHVVLLHALRLLNAVFVPLSTRLAAPELDARLRIVQPALLISKISDSKISDCELSISDFRNPAAGTAHNTHLASPISNLPPAPFNLPPATFILPPSTIIFTSGSSGEPKPVPLSEANFAAAVAASAAHLGVQPDDNWLCPIPLYHVGGVSAVLRSAEAGTCVTLVDGADTAELLRMLRDERVTLASLVPTVLRRLLETDAAFDGPSLPALRAILLGGGPADSRLLDDAAQRALPVLSTYGLTEAASQVATMPFADAARKRGSAGRPLPGMRVSIRNDAGDILPPGERGSIWISGANVITAYLDGRSPERFADGWFNTGDIGRMDEEDFLWVDARREDLILSGGENVVPAEVENALLAHPAVREVCVVGLADLEWGQRVAAALVLGEPDADIRNIEAHCRSLLAGYKIPKRWRVVVALPKGDTGKVLRGAVAALFADGG
jgi:o-succinylbenzoate---CoA ligase